MCSDTLPAEYKLAKHSNKAKNVLQERSQESIQRSSLISEDIPSQQTSLITNKSSAGTQYVGSSMELLPEPPASPRHVQENERINPSPLTSAVAVSRSSIHSAQTSHQGHGDKHVEVCRKATKYDLYTEQILKVDELQKEKEMQTHILEIKTYREIELQNIKDEHKKQLKNGKS